MKPDTCPALPPPNLAFVDDEPEEIVRHAYLQGLLDDGCPISTSAIAKVDGRHVTTHSGSRYLLDGMPHELYGSQLGAWSNTDPLRHTPELLGFEWAP